MKKLKCREGSKLCKFSQLCYLILSSFENENIFFWYQAIPRPSPFGIHWPINFTKNILNNNKKVTSLKLNRDIILMIPDHIWFKIKFTQTIHTYVMIGLLCQLYACVFRESRWNNWSELFRITQNRRNIQDLNNKTKQNLPKVCTFHNLFKNLNIMILSIKMGELYFKLSIGVTKI